MIEVKVNLRCETCREPFLTHPWDDGGDMEKVRLLLLSAELAGWKVYRLATDVHYGKAWCTNCKPTVCEKCNGRGYVPNWKDWDDYHGEPRPKPCPDCQGEE